MTIDVAPEVEARLKAKAEAEGLSLGAYIQRLIFEEDSRRARLDAFQQAIDVRVTSLHNGESVDGEEVMTRLIAEFEAPGRSHITR